MVILPQADKVGSVALAERFQERIELWRWERRAITPASASRPSLR
ncbi:MAG TPA: hypothetical protein VFW40_07625 [Capsulimonadaceae bacterium]|nr:hypothetical protein [Capsulimonadaceae bacterium]